MKSLITSFLLAALTIGLASTTHAAAITVNTTDDELNADGDCSLREAIQAANTNAAVDACAAGSGADVISIPDGTYLLTLGPAGEDANAGGDLDIAESLSLEGASAAGTIIDGNHADSILHVTAAGNLSLARLTLTHGQSPTAGAVFMSFDGDVSLNDVTIDSNLSGGSAAVFLSSGTINLVVNQSRLTNNQSLAPSQGTALGYFSAVAGDANLTDTIFSGNKGAIGGTGGGFFLQTAGQIRLERMVIEGNEAVVGQGGGGFMTSTGDIAVVDSEILTNTAGANGAGLVLVSGGNVTVSSSRIQNNQIPPTLPSQAGGLLISAPTAMIEDSTIDSNQATTGGGIIFSGTTLTVNESTISRNRTAGPFPVSGQAAGLLSTGAVVLRNVTISENATHGPSGQGGGILLSGAGASTATNVTFADNSAGIGEALLATAGTVTFTNSILADSCFAPAPGILLSGGNNIDSNNTCAFSTTTNDLIDTDPLLGPLADNGGPVETHLLLEGSPAIDAGTDTGAPANDARDFGRPKDGNGDGTAKTDIGAVEIGCGDGIVQSFAGESCDDGNTDDTDDCDNSCSSPSCGNGAVEGSEECDNGASNSDTDADACRTSCTNARCGDGVVDAGEQCDDGNTTADDGCDGSCETEAEEEPPSGGGCSLIR